MRRKMAAGNWKMNGLRADLAEITALASATSTTACDVMICPPAPLIPAMLALETGIMVGGQDCHAEQSGAHTGDVSATLLKDIGASAVIVGHSERRADHAETDAEVRAKAEAATSAGLIAIICIGETEAERDAGDTLKVVETQLTGSLPDGTTAANTVVAYEPVWAIGTGKTAQSSDIVEVHAAMRALLRARFGAEVADGIRLLYGGSVKPGNAEEIFSLPAVDGGLVGGASLKAADFSAIVAAASR